jgi:hypothetical protein
MTRKAHDPRSTPEEPPEHARQDETFRRHGPEPPENDAGPSQDGDELFRNPGSTVHNVKPEQQVD